MATVERDTPEPIADLAARCRGEFLEMPGMRLTLPQAARFLGIDSTTCEQTLDHLVRSGFLRKHGTTYGMSIGAVRD
jgi:DNA-binding IclR family transcriptional regulator